MSKISVSVSSNNDMGVVSFYGYKRAPLACVWNKRGFDISAKNLIVTDHPKCYPQFALYAKRGKNGG